MLLTGKFFPRQQQQPALTAMQQTRIMFSKQVGHRAFLISFGRL
jgi:hypothetical protein